MAEEQDRGIDREPEQPRRVASGVERETRFRVGRQISGESFGDSGGAESRPRRARYIPREKKAEVTVSDTRPELSEKVKGKEPEPPKEEALPKTTSKPTSRKLRYTFEESGNQAQFLLSALEIVCVTTAGPVGEMTEWERGVMRAPLQRIIHRTPLYMIERGGIFIDIGVLIVGLSIYGSRVTKNIKLPSFGKGKEKVVSEDREAPLTARPDQVVNTTRAGDLDGLAQPVPTVIRNYLNGAL